MEYIENIQLAVYLICQPHKMVLKLNMKLQQLQRIVLYIKEVFNENGSYNNGLIKIHIHIFVFLPNRIRIVPGGSCQSSFWCWHTTIYKIVLQL